MSVDLSNRQHFIYRAFDVDDRLLYVGRTVDVEKRFSQHRALAPWWSSMVRSAIDGPFDFESVVAYERHAINTERPLWNMDSPMRWQAKGAVSSAESALIDAVLRLGYRLDAWELVRDALSGFPDVKSVNDPMDAERLALVRSASEHICSHADCLAREAHVRLIGRGWRPEFDLSPLMLT